MDVNAAVEKFDRDEIVNEIQATKTKEEHDAVMCKHMERHVFLVRENIDQMYKLAQANPEPQAQTRQTQRRGPQTTQGYGVNQQYGNPQYGNQQKYGVPQQPGYGMPSGYGVQQGFGVQPSAYGVIPNNGMTQGFGAPGQQPQEEKMTLAEMFALKKKEHEERMRQPQQNF